jgi:protein O-GlcNAc transferase
MSPSTAQSDEEKLRRAVALHQNGHLDQAVSFYEEILRSQPGHFNANLLLGLTYAQQNNYSLAAKFFGKAARLNRDSLDAHFNCGLALQFSGQLQEAVEHYDRAIQIKPDHLDAHYNCGSALGELKHFAEALERFDRAILIKPDFAEAHFNRGNTLRGLNRFEEAVKSHDRAILIKPNYPEAHSGRGIALSELKRFEEALASYDRAIQIKPDQSEAHYNRGIALCEMKRFADALTSFNRALELKPDYPDAHFNRANTLSDLKRFEDALKDYDRAILIKPGFSAAYFNRANTLNSLQRFGEALKSYDRAILIEPNYSEAYSGRGAALVALKRFEEALRSCDHAILLKPDHAEAHSNRGVVLHELGRFEEAFQAFDRAIQLEPDIPFLKGIYLHLKMRNCDWSDYSDSVTNLCSRISHGERVTDPFLVLALPIPPNLLRKASEIWIEAKYPPVPALGEIARRPAPTRTRIGYFSADFRDHPVANAIADLIESHDRTTFETIAFSFGPDSGDEMRRRLKGAFDRFIDVQHLSDRDIVLRARELEIDIAVDLNGFTQGARTGLFALRAAPVQVSYLGYPGTMGADYIDYLIADPTLVPASCQADYREKIVTLPNSFFPSDRRREISDRVFTRSELGLPPEGFVFCCFNNNYKITPDVFESWMRILARVEGSVLWLRESGETAARNLRHAASLRSVDPDRLVFTSRMTLPDHLARHRMADLFLDTLPYNAHSTASDALWAGLPVLTQAGETYAGRVAASLLNAVHLPELVTTARGDYEALAIELATDPDRLASLKRKLADNRLATPLFDTELLARHIEAAYKAMAERHRAGLPPDHIHVQ